MIRRTERLPVISVFFSPIEPYASFTSITCRIFAYSPIIHIFAIFGEYSNIRSKFAYLHEICYMHFLKKAPRRKANDDLLWAPTLGALSSFFNRQNLETKKREWIVDYNNEKMCFLFGSVFLNRCGRCQFTIVCRADGLSTFSSFHNWKKDNSWHDLWMLPFVQCFPSTLRTFFVLDLFVVTIDFGFGRFSSF